MTETSSTFHKVTFYLGNKGIRTGKGEIEQYVEDGNSAIEPKVYGISCYEFDGWDTDFNNITSDMIVLAKYKE